MKRVTVGTKRKNFSFRVQEQMWVISHTKQRMVPVATWRDLKRWNVATGSVKAPVQVLPVRLQETRNKDAAAKVVALYIFTFQGQLKDLSGCYEYFGEDATAAASIAGRSFSTS